MLTLRCVWPCVVCGYLRACAAVGGTANYNYNTPVGWRGSQQDTHETAAFILQTVYRSLLANFSWGQREATSYWDVTDV